MVDARHLDKSPDAFRTISEVADDLELPQHVLRFWETRFTHIRPVKRAGGRRYYRPDDVELLRGIRHLLYSEGYTIKGVQKILKDQGVRHVQAIGYDDGEPVAAARERPASPPPAPASEDGGGFGGLLGLLPRRRPRPEVDDPARGHPTFDEPPLPFPDFASFTPRTEDLPEPRRPAPRASEGSGNASAAKPAPPRAAAGAPNPRAEPVFRSDNPDDDAYRPDSVRHDPSFEAAPRRPAAAPPQRPSRGPASRLPEPPASRELEDPLLPFFDDERPPVEQISEPLDARIRRMKDAAPPAPPPAPGPPEEYIPARARKRPAPAPEAPRQAGARAYAPRPADSLDDELAGQGELYGDDESTWQRPVRGTSSAMDPDDFPDDDWFAPPRAPRPRGAVGDDAYGRREAEPYLDAPRAAPQRQARDEDAFSRPRDRSPMPPPPASGRGRQDWPAPARDFSDQPPVPPVMGPRTARDPFFDPPPPVQAPLVAPPRLGPFLGPMEEYDPDEPESHASYRAGLEDQRAGERRAGRDPGQGRRPSDDRPAAREPWSDPGRAADDWGYERASERDPRSRAWDSRPDDDGDESGARRMARGAGEGWREPADDYLPPEPHRPGPPEQYLPPHLRSEPRMTGAPVPPAPLLSRDDISRLQAALYELSECRRLMGAVLADETDDTGGD